jgi:hypothetical protein
VTSGAAPGTAGPQFCGIEADVEVSACLPQHRFLDEPLAEATQQETAGGIAQSPPGIPQLAIRYAPGWLRLSLRAARVIELELDGLVFRDVPGLGGLETLKPLAVTVNHLQAVPHLRKPEVEVGRLTGKLVPVEGDEPRQLVSDQLRHVRGKRHAVKPPFVSQVILLRRDDTALPAQRMQPGAKDH